MARRVGPKNKRTRDSGWLRRFDLKGYVPGSFSWVTGFFRRLGYLFLLVLIGFFLYDFYRFGRTSPSFTVEMEINGNQLIDDSEVKEKLNSIFGDQHKTSLLTISAYQLRKKLSEELPRFKNIHVIREFPNRLIINVEERAPVAIVARYDSNGDRRIFLPAGKQGVLFSARQEEWDRLRQTLPVVLGLEELDPSSSGYQRRWERAMRVKETFEREFVPDMLNWIQIRPGGFAEVQIDKPRKLVIKLGLDRYHQKFQQLNEMMMTEQFSTIEDYVNLRDENEVFVK